MRYDFSNTKKWKQEGNSYKLISPNLEEDRQYTQLCVFKTAEEKGIEDEVDEVIIRGIANAKVIDRMDEVLNPGGIEIASFTKNPVLLFNHDYTKPIGSVTDLAAEADGVNFVAKVGQPQKAELTNLQKEVRSLIRQGVLKTVSVGFIPKKIKQGERDPDGKIIEPTTIEEWELLELSVVSVPANQDSVFEEVDIRQQQNQNVKLVSNEIKERTLMLNDKVISLIFDEKTFSKAEAVQFCVDNHFDFDTVTSENKTFQFTSKHSATDEDILVTEIQEGVKAVSTKDHENELETKQPEELMEKLSEVTVLVRKLVEGTMSNKEVLDEILKAVKPGEEDASESAEEVVEEVEQAVEEVVEASNDDAESTEEKSLNDRLALIEGNMEKFTDILSHVLRGGI